MTSEGSLSKQDALLVGILKLTEATWVTSSDLEALAGTYSSLSVEAKIYLLRELLDIARSLPTTIYNDMGQRTRLVEAAQEALDTTIDAEEDGI